MTLETLIVVLVSALTLFCAGLLWISREYDDGLLGRIGLICMMFSAIIVLTEVFLANAEYSVVREVLLGRVGMALFMLYHVCRHMGWGFFDRRGLKGRRRATDRGVPSHEVAACQSGTSKPGG